MGAGRPPEGLGHVDRLAGPPEDKRRLRVILETLSGERSVEEACLVLGIGEARFHVLRRQALEGALQALAPGHAGRPRREEPEETARVRTLQAEKEELELELYASRVREQLAVLPRVGKKNLERRTVRAKPKEPPQK